MHHWPVAPIVGSRRALAAAIILSAVALVSLFWVTPLKGDATAVSGDDRAPRGGSDRVLDLAGR